MKEVKSYQCEFCTFYRKTKSSVISHEEKCFYNSQTRSCATCKHNEKHSDTMYNPNHGGDPGSTDYEVESRWCDTLDIELTRETLRTQCESWINKLTLRSK